LNEAVRDAAWNSSGPLWKIWLRSPIFTSALVGFVCCWLMLRSWRLCLMVQFTAAAVALAATALVYACGSSMNMVLAVMPTLLFVITLSGAVHLCNYWRHSVSENGTAAISESVRQAWLPCALSAATTAIGLASLLSGTLVPVREFGLYSSIGCVFSLFAVLYLLPAMMRIWPETLLLSEVRSPSSAWPRIASVIAGNSGLNLGITVIVIVAALWGAGNFRTETRAICSFPKSSDLMQDYQRLEDGLAGIVPVDAIVRFSRTQQEKMPFEARAQAVLRLQERLKAHPRISGALSLASFLCTGPQSMSAEDANNAEGSPTPNSRRTGGRLRKNLLEDRIRDAVGNRDAESSTLASWIAVPNDNYSLQGHSHDLLHHSGDEIWRISCQACLLAADDFEVLTSELTKITETELKELRGEAPECLITGLVPILLKTQEALLESLIWSFGLAFLVIGGVMVGQLRSLQAGLWAMLPNVLPVVIVFGAISWLGIRVDVGTMITASVAMGIAVDGTLHLLAGFQEQIRQGQDRRQAAEAALSRSGPALVQSAAIIAFGLLSLYPVELLLISRFGWIMAALTVTALWGDVVLLTGLLAGPLGVVLEAVERRRQPTVADSGESTAAGPEESQIFEIADFPPMEPDQHPHSLRGPHLPLWLGASQLELNSAEDNRSTNRSQKT
jgi:predicted RND superfamily exporter protein